MSTKSLAKCITYKASRVNDWIAYIHRRYKNSVVGLDTKWYKDRETRVHKIAILQLCVEDSCLIFQMWRMDSLPSSLSEFMMDANYTFVGVGIIGDLDMLRDEFNLNCARSKDLAVLAKMKWPTKWKQTPGLETSAREVAEIEMEKDKKITLSNWRKVFLTKEQVEYASLDAYASYKIGVGLQEYFDTPAPTSTNSAYISPASTSTSSTFISPYDDDYYSEDDYDYFIR